MLLLPFEHLPGIRPLFCCQKTSTLSSCRIAQPKRVWQFGHDDKKRLFYTDALISVVSLYSFQQRTNWGLLHR